MANHFLFGTRGIRTANMKMTPSHILIGLTIFGLFLQSGLTIKVPLTNGPYRNSAPVPEQNHRQSSSHQIYEVHHHYVTPSHQHQQQQQQAAHAHHSEQGYTGALQQKQEIRIHHVNHAPSQNANQGDVDISYLSFAAADGPNGQQITVADSLPAPGKAPDYLPPVRQHSSYRAPDYLPPHGSVQEQHSAAHHQQHANIQTQQQNGRHSGAQQHVRLGAPNKGHYAYKGPDYLPPHHVNEQGHQQHQHQQHVVQDHQLQQHEAPYPNVQKLPVQQHQGQQHHAQQNHVYHQQIDTHGQHVQTQQQQEVPLHFKGPDYLPPQATASNSQSSRAPEYLPPVNQIVNSVGVESSTQVLHHVQQQNKQQQAEQVYQQQHVQQHVQEQQHIEQQHHVEQQHYVQPQQQHNVRPQQHYFEQQHVEHFEPQARQVEKAPTSFAELPPGYEFQKPDNAEQAIAQLHTLPEPEPQVRNFQQQVFTEQNYQQQQKLNDYEQQHQTTNYDLLPHAHTVSSSNHQQQLVEHEVAVPYQAPAYLPPATIHSHTQQQHQQQVHHHHHHQQQETQLHSLSSYMNTVQPNERYGASHFTTAPRRPFAEYGPPQHENIPIAPQPQQVAPMYREQSSKPQYYASSMSYHANPAPQAYTTYTAHQHKHVRMNEETRQSLQKFMPKDIQQQLVATAIGKVRTVQIANSNAVKTLKVLETSDDAGVKTIKILGHTNEDPMGDHKVIRVVSPSNVHTVKIFNDQKDVKLPGPQSEATAVTTDTKNSYLPPAANTLSKKRAVRDSRNTLSQPLRHGRPRRAIHHSSKLIN